MLNFRKDGKIALVLSKRGELSIMEIKELLEKVKTGEMELSRAEEILKELPYENLGYANLDHHRKWAPT